MKFVLTCEHIEPPPDMKELMAKIPNVNDEGRFFLFRELCPECAADVIRETIPEANRDHLVNAPGGLKAFWRGKYRRA